MENLKQFKIKLFGHYIFVTMWEAGLGWFRMFGIGIHWKDTTRHRLYFSERNGHRKSLKIGMWRFEFLKYDNLKRLYE